MSRGDDREQVDSKHSEVSTVQLPNFTVESLKRSMGRTSDQSASPLLHDSGQAVRHASVGTRHTNECEVKTVYKQDEEEDADEDERLRGNARGRRKGRARPGCIMASHRGL